MKLMDTLGRRVSVLLGIALVCAGAAGAGWKSVGPAGGGRFSTLFASGGYLLASNLHGVWRSADRGATWDCVQPGTQADYFVEAGSKLYEVGHPTPRDAFLVMVSSDHGATWKSRLAGIDSVAFMAWKSIQASAFIGRYWVVAGADAVYRSADSGATWKKATDLLPWVFGEETRIFEQGGSLIAINRSGCSRSVDSGATWVSKSLGPRPGVRVPLQPFGRFLIGALDDTVYRSPDFGATWQRFPPPSAFDPIVAHGKDLYATAKSDQASRVMRSSDSGETWVEAGRIGKSANQIASLLFMGDTLFAGTVSFGVLRSTDRGAHFEQTSLPAMDVTSLAADAKTLWAGVSGTPGIYRFAADAGTWALTAFSDSALRSIRSIAVDGETVFAAENCCHAHLSRDGGADWIDLPAKVSDLEDIYAAAAQDGAYLIAARKCVYRLSDTASQWRCVQLLPRAPNGDFPALVAAGGSFFLGDSAGVFRSRDGGAHWDTVNHGLQGEVHHLAASGGNLYAGGSQGFFRSMDLGGSWTRMDSVRSSLEALAGAGQALFAGRDTGVYVSQDEGKTWAPANEGLSGAPITSLAVLGPDLYAGTGGAGVWKRPLSELVPGIVNLPGSGFAANRDPDLRVVGTARGPAVVFNVPAQGLVRLDLFDCTGREVAGLAVGVLDRGPAEAALPGREVPPGAYILRLRAGGRENTVKIALTP